jgi:hypothetical protein
MKSVLKDAVSGALNFVASHRKRLTLFACLGLFLASLGHYWVSYDPADSVPHDPESFRLARSLVTAGQFANPFVPLDTGSSAHLAPAFPAFLAVLIRVFRDGSAGIYAIKLTAVLVLSMHLGLFPLYSRALGMGALSGIVAAFIWIIARVGIARDHPPIVMFGWEAFYAAALVAGAVSCCRRLESSKHPIRMAWLLGFLLGALALTSPTAGGIFVAWFAWIGWRRGFVLRAKPYLIAILLPIVITAPWLVRNYLVFHRLILVRDNFGLEVAVSNNDCAMFGISQNLETGCFERVHPNANLEEARKVLADGEPNYNQERLQGAKRWIRSHPVQFLKLSTLRFAAFWFPPSSRSDYSLLGRGRVLERFTVYLMTLLSVVGLYMLYRTDRQSTLLCVFCFSFYPLVYYIVQYEYRYRYSILWLTFLLGAIPISALARRALSSIASARSEPDGQTFKPS